MKKTAFFMGLFLVFALLGSADFVDTSGVATESQIQLMELLGLAVGLVYFLYFVVQVRLFHRENNR